ncbi:hypothetical protein [Amycolatopsis thermoflava]|uniref:hypothetical protein n=1 Tax=Amycolatopsis thermoflava TaxID=84480 RepID=UPI00366010A9
MVNAVAATVRAMAPAFAGKEPLSEPNQNFRIAATASPPVIAKARAPVTWPVVPRTSPVNSRRRADCPVRAAFMPRVHNVLFHR